MDGERHNKKRKESIMSNRRIGVYEDNYLDHPINASREKNQPCDKKILKRIEDVLDNALSKHSRILVYRFDVRCPQNGEYSDTNKLFARGEADVVKYLTRKGLDPSYLAVRERSGKEGNHYHVLMTLDASKTLSPYGHLKKTEMIFERKFGLEADGNHGVINYCDHDRKGNPVPNSYIVHRDNEEEYNNVFRRASYMAKIHSKTDDGKREMFASTRRKKQ